MGEVTGQCPSAFLNDQNFVITIGKPLRLSLEAKQLLRQLAARLSMSQAAVLELLMRAEAQREGIT